MQTDIFEKHWFWVGVAAAVLLVARLAHLPPLPQFEGGIYDASIGLVHKSPGSADKIAIVSIGKKDLAQTKPRIDAKEALTRLIQELRQSRAKSIGVLLPLSEPSYQPATETLEKMRKFASSAKLSKQEKYELGGLIAAAGKAMDADARLTDQVASAHNVFFPFHLSEEETPELPEFLRYYMLTSFEGSAEAPAWSWFEAAREEKSFVYDNSWPLEDFISAARGLGYFSLVVDVDNEVRTVPVATRYNGELLASLPLVLAAHSLDKRVRDIEIVPGHSVTIGNRTIAVDYDNRMYPSFFSGEGDEPVFPLFTYSQVMTRNFDAGQLRNKIVLVDAAEFYRSRTFSTPAGEMSGAAEFLAHAVTSILNEDVYKRPAAFIGIEFAIFALLVGYLLLLPYFGRILGLFISLSLLLALLGAEEFLLLSQQSWLHAGVPILLLVIGHIVVEAVRLYSLQHAKHSTDVHYANRQLGLALQEQGKLERAMERFLRLPPSKDNLELIYNLALDFERKRKFNNAASAYKHIIQQKPGFRDVKKRMEQAEQMQQSMMLGTSQFTSTGPLILTGKGEMPMLGRYEIEKEIGKGAMGAVYLGRDPKINRVVAIKTLAISNEFESEEAEEVRNRFFHEASAAGRLNHPNIVTIYDAAEDHDLSYIAMEYIEGESLDKYTRKNTLLPIPVVLDLAAKMADAIDYASKQDVVHRDIKPANIMFNKQDGTLKITDFGIARIVSSGRTKTGMLLGTPSYMSPEQMNGAHVDGRSDIFSLGATMFVLLTGQKPFAGDSLAALSYKIVNEKHPDITQLRKDVPESVKKIIDKALQKKPERRYQTGKEMKQDIARSLKTMKGKG